MEESLGCWFNQVFIRCDECKYGSDVVRCAGFRKEFWAHLGHEEPRVDKINDTWM